MASMPALHQSGDALYTIPGLPPDMGREINGCAFAARCEFAQENCRSGEMMLKEMKTGQKTACIRVQAGEVVL
jgi:oligopeptide/dipeptide ABC transporter ATP-binding protein